MENASNALLMAAGVLVGVLVMSLAVYLFVDFGTTAANINSQISEQKLVQFNTKFTSYEGLEELTIYDVITVANYAKENNEYYQESLNEYEIKVYLGNASRQIQNYTESQKISLIENDKNLITTTNLNLPKYSCKVISFHTNGRVNEIIFTKNP